MFHCVVCMIVGLTNPAETIIDGQALCGRHTFRWKDYMDNTSHAANPASTRLFDFWGWLKVYGG